MKAEIEEKPGERFLKVIDDDGMYKGLYLEAAELDAIHAALTEWKAKREEKPKAPTWRAWKDASDVPTEAMWLRQKVWPSGIRTLFSTKQFALWIHHAGMSENLDFESAFKNWEWSPNAKDWSCCGVLET